MIVADKISCKSKSRNMAKEIYKNIKVLYDVHKKENQGT